MNVMQLCFSFQGRISRKTYWVTQFLLWMLTLILFIILNRIVIPPEAYYDRIESVGDLLDVAVLLLMPTVYVNLVVIAMIVDPVGSLADLASSLDVFLILLAPALVNFAVLAKRWHDRNKSAWWAFIHLVPIIGVLWTFVELGFFRGTTGKNRFGLDPLQLR